MHNTLKSTGLISAALILVSTSSTSASAQAFSAPIQLSKSIYHYSGGTSSGFEINSIRSNIDDAGTALVTWFDNGKYYYTERPANGAWGSPSIINGSETVGSKAISSELLVSPSGVATLITYADPPYNTGAKEQIYQGSIWYQDKVPGGNWTAPQLAVNNATLVAFQKPRIRLVMNKKGDQAIVFQQTRDNNLTNQITAIRRSAGGAWGAQSTVATAAPPATNLQPDSAALGANGDLVISYTLNGYEAVCGVQNYCYFTPHVARQTSDTKSWMDTALAVKNRRQYATDVTIDDDGRAAVLIKGGPGLFFKVARQIKAGNRWSSVTATPLPNVLRNDSYTYEYTSFEYGKRLSEAGIAGQASFQSLATDDVMDGNIMTNSWLKTPSPLHDIPGDPYSLYTHYDFNSKGGALVSKIYTSPSTPCGSSVSSRVTSTDSWSAPQSIAFNVSSGPSGYPSCTRTTGNINSSGHAVMTFITDSGDFPDSQLTLYAITK